MRQKIGDAKFLSLMRTWYRENRGRNVRTADFIRTAERISRRDLDHFFQVWLFEEGRPTDW